MPLSTDAVRHVRDHCLCLHTQRAARVLARRFDHALQPLQLTNGQFSLLMALTAPEPARMGPLADFLAMDRTSLTAALKPLHRRELVTITPDPKDRRGRVIDITPAGRALLQQALPIWQATHDEIDRELGFDLEAGLRNGLNQVVRRERGNAA